MAEVEVGGGRVEAGLDAERLARLEGPLELLRQLFLLDAGVDPLQEELELLGDGRKVRHGPGF